ncbi:MAG TPA: glycoside hydrolase family 88 protein [Pseudonocardiaceae bacterium]|nr:glycoside hydrolase family 88 protein [Pseudonocardiaceae bacterium]
MSARWSLVLSVGGLVAGGLLAAPPATAAPLCSVEQNMVSADQYWVANGTDTASNNWENSAFHVGNLAMVRTTGVTNHVTLPWADANMYQLATDPNQPFRADDDAVGEAYLALQFFHPIPANLQALRDRIAAEDASVQQGHNQYWNNPDALNFAMPSFAQIGVLDDSQADLETMHTLFEFTRTHLFNQFVGLWRDNASGTTFPSRGNGQAFAALAKVLATLPATDPHRAEYTQVFQRMAFTLLLLQRNDGFWNVDLTNPFDHPGPETSGTALFTYGLAWGVDNHVLPAWLYTPAVRRAWNGMVTTALQPSGLLGFVQGQATGPTGGAPVTATDTAAYGVGYFLLAGQQVAQLTPGC